MREKDRCLTDVESGDYMPPVATIERERELYYRNLKKYLEAIKALPEKEAASAARANLRHAGIIDENDDLTDRYKNSRQK